MPRFNFLHSQGQTFFLHLHWLTHFVMLFTSTIRESRETPNGHRCSSHFLSHAYRAFVFPALLVFLIDRYLLLLLSRPLPLPPANGSPVSEVCIWWCCFDLGVFVWVIRLSPPVFELLGHNLSLPIRLFAFSFPVILYFLSP